MPDFISKGGTWVRKEPEEKPVAPDTIVPINVEKKAEEVVEAVKEVKVVKVKKPVTKSKPRGRPKKGR